jgi:hypothetical protein
MIKKAADGYTNYGAKAGTPSPATDYAGKPGKQDSYTQYKQGGVVKKAKSGGSFPDLNKDGKVTKADILKGRGVIAKKGSKVAKKMMKNGGTLSAPKKDGLSMQLGSYKGTIGKNTKGKNVVNKGAKAKMGKTMSKCKYGC